MRFPFCWLLSLLLATAAAAMPRAPEPPFVKGTPVVVIGKVTSPPKTRLGEQKLQVAVGPEHSDYTLHFFRAQVLGLDGRPLEEGGFHHRMWLRAEGVVMNDPRRIKVSRLQVIAKDREGLAHTAYLPAGVGQGYIESVSGSRQSTPGPAGRNERAVPILVVGRAGGFTSSGGAAGPTLKAAGVEWSVELPEEARIVDRLGSTITASQIQPDLWVRVQGWRTGELHVRAERVTLIGTNGAWRASRFYRTEQPLGYAESTDEPGLERKTLRGTVRQVDLEQGTLTLETSSGRVRRIWMPAAEIRVLNRSGDDALRAGDQVEVMTLRFP